MGKIKNKVSTPKKYGSSQKKLFQKNFLNSKGFLFTLAVVLFASTIVLFSQTFSNFNVDRERSVLISSKTLIQPFFNDDISYDLMTIIGLNIETQNESNYVVVKLSGNLPQSFDVGQKLSDYNSFLNNTFFSFVQGTQTIDLTNIQDGSVEMFLGDEFNFSYDYDNNFISFSPVSSTLNSIDLNLDFAGDLSSIDWLPVAGSIPLTLNYSDDSNTFSLSESISATSASTLILFYSDSNISIVFGDTGTTNSVNIDSNSSSILTYSLGLNYNYDLNYLPMVFNSYATITDTRIDSNAMLKVIN